MNNNKNIQTVTPKGTVFTATPAEPRVIYGVLVENKGDNVAFDITTDDGRKIFYSANVKSLAIVGSNLVKAMSEAVDR